MVKNYVKIVHVPGPTTAQLRTSYTVATDGLSVPVN